MEYPFETSNALTKNYRGKFGNQVVFRNRFGKSILAALPVRVNDNPSEAQINVRKRFANAAQYARQILLDPDMHAAFSEKPKGGNRLIPLPSPITFARLKWRSSMQKGMKATRAI